LFIFGAAPFWAPTRQARFVAEPFGLKVADVSDRSSPEI